MTLFTKGENKIGYKVTVWSSTGKTTSHRGYSEDDPLLTNKIRSKLITQLPTMALKALVSGGQGVSAIFATAGVLGGTLGQTVSAVVMKGLDTILLRKAKNVFNANPSFSLGVTLAGDYQANYKIASPRDLDALIGFLSIIPATFNVGGKPYWMGKSVIKCLYNEQLGSCIAGGNAQNLNPDGTIYVRYTIDV